MFASRIELGARDVGLDPRIAATALEASAGLAAGPAVVVVDVQAPGIDAAGVIREAVRGGARVLAFGRHTEPAALRAAREAGADEAVARSQIAEQLPELLARLGATRER
jgi:DNA-binding NarL/FixJ family response regulator